MPSTFTCDLAILGGGLAGCLTALAVQARHPEVDIRIVEAGETFGGNHLWSFFGSDVAQDDRWLLAPVVSHAWADYDIRFPRLSRTLPQAYYSIKSDQLDAHVRASFGKRALMTGRKVLACSATAVVLADGDRIEAKGVIDARGPGDAATLELGYQKFVGCELRIKGGHGLERPIVMDATVAQEDGYRFVYCLPFSTDTLLVEDTYYSDTPTLDEAALARRIEEYTATRGWTIADVIRSEHGVLPVAMGGDFEAYWQSTGKVAKAGLRAGLFHPMTGYSLPDAVRLAHAVSRAEDLSGAALHELTYDHAAAAWRERKFYRLLARMLFRAADPAKRWRVLERFYRLNPALVARFYAGQSTFLDKARVLAGKPPVRVTRAIGALRGVT